MLLGKSPITHAQVYVFTNRTDQRIVSKIACEMQFNFLCLEPTGSSELQLNTMIIEGNSEREREKQVKN